MHLVQIVAGAGPMYCGACARDAALARGLIRRGHEVSIIPIYTPLRLEDDEGLPQGPLFLGGINAYLREQYRWAEKLPSWIQRALDNPGLIRFASSFAVQTQASELGAMTVSMLKGMDGPHASAIEALVQHIAAGAKPDAILLPNTMLIALAPELRKRIDAPVFCSVQGEDGFLDELTEPWKSLALESIRARTSLVKRFIAPSRSHAEHMAELLQAPLQSFAVAKVGIEVPERRALNLLPNKSFAIGHLSSIRRAKGLDVLVEAVRILVKEQRRDVSLSVCGRTLEPKFLREIKARITGSGLSKRVHFAGELAPSEKFRWIGQMDVFSFPSRLEESRGVAALEVLGSGVPVVAPSRGVFPEMAKELGGIELHSPEDPISLANALASLMDDPKRRTTLGLEASHSVHENRSINKMAESAESALGLTPPAKFVSTTNS